jgi:AhpD family alkylhydroperoxidase
MTGGFRKRYFTRPRDLFRESRRARKHLRAARKVGPEHALDARLREKIMLAVCAVNKCRNCSYLHTRTTLESGVGDGEIKQLLAGELGDFPKREAAALAYVQHFTEYGERTSPEARRRIVEHYGPEKTLLVERDAVRVQLGNLICNTAEARAAVKNPPAGRFLFYLVYLLCAPIALAIRKLGERGRRFLADNRIEIE